MTTTSMRMLAIYSIATYCRIVSQLFVSQHKERILVEMHLMKRLRQVNPLIYYQKCIESLCRVQAIPGIYLDQSSGYWAVKGGCAAVANLPPLTFTIGGVNYDLPPQIYTRPVCASSCSQRLASLCIPGGCIHLLPFVISRWSKFVASTSTFIEC